MLWLFFLLLIIFKIWFERWMFLIWILVIFEWCIVVLYVNLIIRCMIGVRVFKSCFNFFWFIVWDFGGLGFGIVINLVGLLIGFLFWEWVFLLIYWYIFLMKMRLLCIVVGDEFDFNWLSLKVLILVIVNWLYGFLGSICLIKLDWLILRWWDGLLVRIRL